MGRRLLPFATTLALCGCSFDASEDYSVRVSWLINGLPPDQSTCDAFGVDRVRLHVRSSSHDRYLEAACATSIVLDDGYDYGGFESTRAFSYDTTYSFDVEMLDADGNGVKLQREPLAYSDTFRVKDWDVDYYELQPLELFSPFGNMAGVDGAFTVRGKVPTSALCAAEEISKVYLDIASATDGDFVNYETIGEATCEEGFIAPTDVGLARGEYFMRYVAVNAVGDTIDELVPADTQGNFELYRVDSRGTVHVSSVDFR
jgi:hypothetical protein